MTAISPPEIGCIIPGHTGQYAGALLLDFARTYGFEHKALELADRKLLAMAIPSTADLTVDEDEALIEAVDDALEWLNVNVAQEGCSFDWYEGEIFYQTEAWWAE